MTDRAHWPFGNDGGFDVRSRERGHTSAKSEAGARKRIRLDRFIVGGRAHSRKHGLS